MQATRCVHGSSAKRDEVRCFSARLTAQAICKRKINIAKTCNELGALIRGSYKAMPLLLLKPGWTSRHSGYLVSWGSSMMSLRKSEVPSMPLAMKNAPIRASKTSATALRFTLQTCCRCNACHVFFVRRLYTLSGAEVN